MNIASLAVESTFVGIESTFVGHRKYLRCGLTILVDHFKLYLYYELTQLLLICNSR